MAHKFVALPQDGEKVYLYSFNSASNKIVKYRQVLWGDWLSIEDNHVFPPLLANGWLAVDWAPLSSDGQKVYIPASHTTDVRPLEIIFLDVGQGDGAVLITPERDSDERIMIIDAGERDNMHRFLNKRFQAYRGFDFYAAILTHPDKDHYLGFKTIFQDHNIGFDKIYHNGLVERPVSGEFEKVGGIVEEAGEKYMKALAKTTTDIEDLFSDDWNFGRYVFPPVMHAALENPKISTIEMLSTSPNQSTIENSRAFMPGFAPSDGRAYKIEVLGPVAEFDGNGDEMLRRISSKYGETKNGHSIILRLQYGKYRILFGGDLNVRAEKFLLQHYTGRTTFPRKDTAASDQMILDAKPTFGAEVMKVCHHGASDVTDEFMETVNPACFVISSGDNEGHVHPRPDLLGRLGKFGRGESPVLLSTELQRSTREKEDQDLIQSLTNKIEALTNGPSNSWKSKVKEQIQTLSKTNVDVYGSIYLKTDGNRLITAFKIETGSQKKKWFYFEYKIDNQGVLELC